MKLQITKTKQLPLSYCVVRGYFGSEVTHRFTTWHMGLHCRLNFSSTNSLMSLPLWALPTQSVFPYEPYYFPTIYFHLWTTTIITFNRSNRFIFVCNKDTSGEQLCPTSFVQILTISSSDHFSFLWENGPFKGPHFLCACKNTFIKQSITFLFYPLVSNKWFTFTVTSKGVIAIVWAKPLQEHLCSHRINYACDEHRFEQTCHIKKLSTHKHNIQLFFY